MTSKENEITKLKKENEILKKKLEIAQKWMEKEVKLQVHKIAKRKVSRMTHDSKTSFLNDHIEEMIWNKIVSYFSDLLLLNAPSWTVESITASEIAYFNIQQNPKIDWLGVISSYHKVLDLFIESFLTKDFRKYALKNKYNTLKVNDPLEKALYFVVTKWYILSVWRFYALIKMIRNNETLHPFARAFSNFLDKNIDLKDQVLSDDFYEKMTTLNESEVLWSKRHTWTISFDETKKTRDLLVWNFEDNNSIFYMLLAWRAVLY